MHLSKQNGARAVAGRRGMLARVPSLYTTATFAVLLAVFIIALAPRLDTDLWWHLEAGRYIAAHHAVPTHDYFSFTFRGRTWTDHEWLSELLLYGLYRLAGLWGTIIFFAVLICATYALVYAVMVRKGINRVLSLFVLCAAFICASPTWGARPQMWTLFFLALFAVAFERYEATRDTRILAVFPVAMVLWANLHGGFALGIGYLAVMLVGHWIDHRLYGDTELGGREVRNLAICLALTVAATAINPNGLREVLYPLVWLYPTAYANLLSEWLSVDFHQPQFMVFEALMLLLVVAGIASRGRPRWSNILLIVAFTHLALSQGRNVAVWSVLITPLVAAYVQDAYRTARLASSGSRGERRQVSDRHSRILNLVFLVLVCVAYPAEGAHYITPSALKDAETQQYPTRAVAYLNRHALSRNVFAPYTWGGYVVWKTGRRYSDFIDGRANTLFDARILNDYLLAYNAQPEWVGVFSKYRVGTVVIQPSSPLVSALENQVGWRRVYGDDQAVVFEKAS
jgi:hypothetical protein